MNQSILRLRRVGLSANSSRPARRRRARTSAASVLRLRSGKALPPIDISTPEALTKTLLAARAVSYTNPSAGGTAGLYFAGLLQKLGIADEVNKRAVLSSGGRDAAEKGREGRGRTRHHVSERDQSGEGRQGWRHAAGGAAELCGLCRDGSRDEQERRGGTRISLCSDWLGPQSPTGSMRASSSFQDNNTARIVMPTYADMTISNGPHQAR